MSTPLTRVDFYCDGACRGNHLGNGRGTMGAGIVAIHPTDYQEFTIPLGKGTSQQAELLAIYQCLLLIGHRDSCHITIHTDSAYAIGALTGGWSLKKNLDTIALVVVLMDECGQFEIVKVAGHSGHQHNEVAHRLAVAASRR